MGLGTGFVRCMKCGKEVKNLYEIYCEDCLAKKRNDEKKVETNKK
jgi:DNA-directed RNA polymerase subunit N (RpoN/RPB10)